jgi:uncharacterized membrane protein YbaN (DUF454 family)
MENPPFFPLESERTMGVPDSVKRMLFVLVGTLFLAIGFIGIIVPVLPTTPLLLLAAACYLRGSERLHRWMINNRIFGEFIRNYTEGRGIKPGQKAVTLAFLWMTISFSALYLIENLPVRILLFLIATAVSVHVLALPSMRSS